jgi:type IV pilus assembly protein PilW
MTLIELMVAMVIGLVLSGAVVMIYDNNKHAYLVQNNTAELQENGRHALHLLREDIRMAGYWGLNYAPESISNAETIALTDECATNWATDYTSPLTAVNNANTGYTSCISNADYKNNTDILTVRHVSSQPLTAGVIAKDSIYLFASLTEGIAFVADDDATIDSGISLSETPTALYRVLAHAYFIRPYSQADDADNCDPKLDGNGDSDGIPTLVRVVISGAKVDCVALIEYVEDFQVTFGLDTDGNGSVDLYVNNGIDASAIASVMTIEVEILVRSPNVEANYTNTRSYQLGDRVYTVNDGFRRQVFRDAIHLRNWSGLST